jgi:hypothetical protein
MRVYRTGSEGVGQVKWRDFMDTTMKLRAESKHVIYWAAESVSVWQGRLFPAHLVIIITLMKNREDPAGMKERA